MKSLSPEQEVYDTVFQALQDLGEKEDPGFAIYTHSPPKGTAYPFVKIGLAQVVPLVTKDCLLGTIYLDLDVWGAYTDRGRVADIAIQILQTLSTIKQTDSFFVSMNYANSSYIVRPDQSTNEDLWRALITTEWQLG